MAFLGSSVVGGSGRGVVVATGRATYFGKTASLMKETPHEGEFQKSIRKFSRLMLWVVLLMTLSIFAVNALLAKGIFSSFLFALALAVGITPEILPIVVTVTLSRAAVRLAREKVVVKRLVSVEDLGNIDVLCCDKTGTLTQGEVSLSDYQNLEGKRDDRVVLYGLLSSFRLPERGRALAGNPIDRAVWSHEKAKSLEAELGHYSVLGRNEFDFERRRTSVLVEERSDHPDCQGAPESVLKVCASAQVGGQDAALTPHLISSITARITAYESDGLRTIALATKTVEAKTTHPEMKSASSCLDFCFSSTRPKTVKASLDMLGSRR
jgi:Mg2+-importing ATPase